MKFLILSLFFAVSAAVLWSMLRAAVRGYCGGAKRMTGPQLVAEGYFASAETREFKMPMGLPTLYTTTICFTGGRRCAINGELGQPIEPGRLIRVWRQSQDDFSVEVVDWDGTAGC